MVDTLDLLKSLPISLTDLTSFSVMMVMGFAIGIAAMNIAESTVEMAIDTVIGEWNREQTSLHAKYEKMIPGGSDGHTLNGFVPACLVIFKRNNSDPSELNPTILDPKFTDTIAESVSATD